MKKLDFYTILVRTLMIMTIILILWRLFGNSPTKDDILVGILTTSFAFFFKDHKDIGILKVHNNYTKKALENINLRFDKVDRKFDKMAIRFEKLETELITIKNLLLK